jgi:hypothetical protein
MPARSKSAQKVQRHRARLRAQGLKPIQIWVPDVNDPKFIEEAHRQSLAVAQSPHEKEELAFLDSLWEEHCANDFFDK